MTNKHYILKESALKNLTDLEDSSLEKFLTLLVKNKVPLLLVSSHEDFYFFEFQCDRFHAKFFFNLKNLEDHVIKVESGKFNLSSKPALNKIINNLNKDVNKYFKPARSSIYTRTSPVSIGLNSNYIHFYESNSQIVQQTCCMNTKTIRSFTVYIPMLWLHYHNFSMVSVRRWIDFINKALKTPNGVKIGDIVKAKGTLPAALLNQEESYPILVKGSNYCTNVNITKINPGYELLKIHINAEKDPSQQCNGSRMLQYIKFILVRYLFNSKYDFLPTLILNTYKEAKGVLSPWQSILVANMREDSDGYYNIIKDRQTVDISEPIESFKERLASSSSTRLHDFFSDHKLSLTTIKKYIREKKFKELL